MSSGAAIDWSIRIGDLVGLVGFIAGGVSGAILLGRNVERVVARVEGLETGLTSTNEKIDKQSEEIGKLGEVITMIGRFEERFLGLRREIDDLKRGRGFIVEESSRHPVQTG
jgi:hypothetical protein